MINTSASASSAVNMEISKSAAPTSQTPQKPAAANKKKKGFSYLAPSSNQSQQQSATESDEWKRKLESNKASSMTTAEAFTKQFVQNELTTSTSATTEHRTVETIETAASVMSEAVSNSTLIT